MPVVTCSNCQQTTHNVRKKNKRLKFVIKLVRNNIVKVNLGKDKLRIAMG